IGENTWGKSSLLRALWVALGRGEDLCSFSREDLYEPVPILGEDSAPGLDDGEDMEGLAAQSKGRPGISEFTRKRRRRRSRALEDLKERSRSDPSLQDEYEQQSADTYRASAGRIQFDFIFAEGAGANGPLDIPELKRFWNYGTDGVYRLHWRISAQDEGGEFTTRHSMVTRGTAAPQEEMEAAARFIIRLCPVLRIRDHRMLSYSKTDTQRVGAVTGGDFQNVEDYIENGPSLTGSEMKRLLGEVEWGTKRYLASYSGPEISEDNSRGGRLIVSNPITLETLSNIRETINRPGINKAKMLTALLAGVVIYSKGDRTIEKNASPVLIFEDIEARFHPSMLLSLWSIIDSVRIQKIVTTNSSDLVSAVPLTSIRRLYRPFYDTRSYKIQEDSLSAEDERRIAFHLRINRPSSFFARTWLLVEGETEIWILMQVAALLGVSLPCKGIRPIEFAQCGLSPILKIAKQLGIACHVLTDGDEAGRKYYDTVRRFCGGTNPERYVTVLPSVDIEHFLYRNGYDFVYKDACGVRGGQRKALTADRIIDLAIRRRGKPDLAVAVIEQMQRRGSDGVPQLFRDLIKGALELSRGDYI
ncbi:MAG: DUF2813 domain-containing protein, partial [Succinivibrio sp.]